MKTTKENLSDKRAVEALKIAQFVLIDNSFNRGRVM